MILAVIEGVGISINRGLSNQFKPGMDPRPALIDMHV